MTDPLHKLARIGSDAVRPEPAADGRLTDALGHQATQELLRLLRLKNGFYAFESALHVLSDLGDSSEQGLLAWNSENLWRKNYEGMADGAVFFAEDVFGMQFCVRDQGVSSFDPETGAFELIATSIESWAEKILDDYEFLTGYPLAHEWQLAHGPIPRGARLVPTIPFVLGGEYSVTNVHVVESVKGMRYRASIATQIRDLPDGTPVTLRVVE